MNSRELVVGILLAVFTWPAVAQDSTYYTPEQIKMAKLCAAAAMSRQGQDLGSAIASAEAAYIACLQGQPMPAPPQQPRSVFCQADGNGTVLCTSQ